MKKLIIIVIAILIILLAGCQPSNSGEQTSENATTEATQMTEPSAPSTVTTAPPPTETEPAPTDAPSADHYALSPGNYTIFTYTGESPSQFVKIDTSDCVIGNLYVYDKTLGKMYLIAQDASLLDYTAEHVYYYLRTDQSTLYRSEYTEATHEQVCSVDGKITAMTYYGVNANGLVFLVEDEQRVWKYDIATSAAEIIMEQYYILNYIHYDEASELGKSDETGFGLIWNGKVSEQDENINTYVYFLDSGLNWIPPWH